MRGLHKSWDNRKELRIKGRYNGWKRHVRWYQDGPNDIRLNFENEDGTYNRFYTDPEKSQADWDAFKKG